MNLIGLAGERCFGVWWNSWQRLVSKKRWSQIMRKEGREIWVWIEEDLQIVLDWGDLRKWIFYAKDEIEGDTVVSFKTMLLSNTHTHFSTRKRKSMWECYCYCDEE